MNKKIKQLRFVCECMCVNLILSLLLLLPPSSSSSHHILTILSTSNYFPICFLFFFTFNPSRQLLIYSSSPFSFLPPANQFTSSTHYGHTSLPFGFSFLPPHSFSCYKPPAPSSRSSGIFWHIFDYASVF